MTDKELQENAADLVEEKTTEESDFLSQWQKRHQAYLDGLKKETEVPPVEEAPSEPVEKTSFLKRPKKREIDPLQVPEDREIEAVAPALPKAKKDPIPARVWLKSSPIILAALLGIATAAFFLSPLSKKKEFVVTGNSHLSTDQVLAYSLFSKKEYTLSAYVDRKQHAQNIKNSSNWVKKAQVDYQFPYTFTIAIEEYRQMGYVERDQAYYSVLSSGQIEAEATAQEALPEQTTLIHLKDQELIQKLVQQLAQVDVQITDNIQSITLTPTKTTSDLLTLTMQDGNTILVPLSEIARKLPYYQKIAPQLAVPSHVDMEVGIFSYAS